MILMAVFLRWLVNYFTCSGGYDSSPKFHIDKAGDEGDNTNDNDGSSDVLNLLEN